MTVDLIAFGLMGASHAQRDVFHQYLIAATIRDGRLARARALLSERTLARPNSAGAWLKYAGVLEDLGDADAAARTRERASRVEAAN